MEELIEYIIENIVKNPKDVTIEKEDGENEEVTVYVINVNEEDKGIVIGKGGRTINAIRDIVKIKAIREGVRVFVKVA